MKPAFKILLFSAAGLAAGYAARKMSVSPGQSGSESSATASSGDVAATVADPWVRLRARLTAVSAEEWLRELTPLLRTDPKRTMAFIFHELPPEMSLKLLPLLGPELARMDDGEITVALAEARTKKELQAAWGAVVGARFHESPEGAVKLARSAPPAGNGPRLLVKAAAAGGTPDLLRLADAGAPKSWFLTPYTGEPEWLKKAPITASLELLHAMKAKFGREWTDQDTLMLATYAPAGAADKAALFAEVINGPLRSGPGDDGSTFVRNCAQKSPENLKLLFELMPEGYQKRKLAEWALARVPSYETEKLKLVKESLPAAESVSAIRKPLLKTVEDRVTMGSVGGKRHDAYDFAATADAADQPFLIKYAVDYTSKWGGIPGVLKSLPDASDAPLTETVYAEAARLFIRQRAEGFKEEELKVLRGLTPEQAAKLRAAVAAGGAEALAGKMQ